MEYVPGEQMAALMRAAAAAGKRITIPVILRIVVDALAGLAAAHRATDDHGQPLHVVHRDVSPHNLIVGADGVTRVTDFGVARAAGSIASTESGQSKGQLSCMAPAPAAATPAPTAAAQDPQAVPEDSGSDLALPSYILMGAGGAALIGSLITGLVAHGTHSDLSETCDNGLCPPSAQADIDSGESMALVSTVLMFVGIAAGGAGAALFILDQQDDQQPSPDRAGLTLAPGPTPLSVGARLRF